jgi:hypothetical protein
VTSYSLLTPLIPGQPPKMEYMTLNLLVEESFGASSVVKETWHEPPLWLAEPVNASLSDWPTFMDWA